MNSRHLTAGKIKATFFGEEREVLAELFNMSAGEVPDKVVMVETGDDYTAIINPAYKNMKLALVSTIDWQKAGDENSSAKPRNPLRAKIRATFFGKTKDVVADLFGMTPGQNPEKILWCECQEDYYGIPQGKRVAVVTREEWLRTPPYGDF
jgi:hypothetical protein